MRFQPLKSSTLAALALATVAAIAGGCASHKADPMNAVSGSIAYRGDIALSPDAVAYVRLADVSDDIVGGRTIMQTEVHATDAGAIDGSLPFSLAYHENAIQPNHEYAVDVRVVDKGRLMLLSDGKHAVLTNGHGNTLDLSLETPGRTN
jgi:putative lipoprotein